MTRPPLDPTSARIRLRPDVGELVRQGLTEREIAHRLGVSRSTVWQIKQDLAKAGAR